MDKLYSPTIAELEAATREWEAKYNFMVDSAQLNARERDEFESAVEFYSGYQGAMGDVARAAAEKVRRLRTGER